MRLLPCGIRRVAGATLLPPLGWRHAAAAALVATIFVLLPVLVLCASYCSEYSQDGQRTRSRCSALLGAPVTTTRTMQIFFMHTVFFVHTALACMQIFFVHPDACDYDVFGRSTDRKSERTRRDALTLYVSSDGQNFAEVRVCAAQH